MTVYSQLIENTNSGYVSTHSKRYIYVTVVCVLLITIVFVIYFITKTTAYEAISGNVRTRMVCYYNAPSASMASLNRSQLQLIDIDGELCTHINIGEALLQNSMLYLTADIERLLDKQLHIFRTKYPSTKLLLWIGGDSNTFSTMTKNHKNRKIFLRSVKLFLDKYAFDGIDLDWEFPSAHNKERQHFSQLLMEIRREWTREQRVNTLLSVAVPAPEGIAFYAYDGNVLNEYADYINLMTYDFHFFAKDTPFTGLNAPLFARHNERSILATININYSINWWLRNGIARNRLVVGLPTYGHSYKLLNYFNNGIGAPAVGFGDCGYMGFTTYSETCRCGDMHLNTNRVFDTETCSPYMSAFSEWISYENERSIKCKSELIVSMKLGGVMMFSLNADDWSNVCGLKRSTRFPLIQTANHILRSN